VRTGFIFAVSLAASCALAHAQLRIVDYNTSGARTGLDTVLAAIGAENVNGIAKPLDIISLQEQATSGADTATIVGMLNSLYGAGTYASTTLLGASTGAGTQTIVYNTKSVQLVGQALVGTATGTGQTRQALRAEFQPIGYDSSSDFYIYADHFKASDDATSANRRNIEAQAVRANADALGAGQNIIYTGDFNVYRSTEAMWTTMTASGNGQAIDPINKVGNWHGSPGSFLTALTQSPVTTARYGGQTTGGLDDRFDFQLVTSALMDSEGLAVITSSYHTFGNDGSVAVNADISTASVASLQSRLTGYTTAQASAVITALGTASDHLPVVADYQLPAKMGVAVGSTPARIIKGANTSASVTVSNTANVIAASGADELDYTVTGGGAASGTVTGTDLALGGGNTYQLTLRSDVIGAQSGLVSVHSPSQGVPNPDFSSAISYTVLDHSQPLFLGQGGAVTLTLDFGTVAESAAAGEQTFAIGNWTSTFGDTAGLDLDSILAALPAGPFTTDLATFSDLQAGNALTFHVTMSTDAIGTFDQTYTLQFSDEDLPGAANSGTLSLHVIGQVTAVPEPAVISLVLVALAVGGVARIVRRHPRVLP
jgi:endonuclease/exonuclease/phosphatase family metal-dependent hydrolase